MYKKSDGKYLVLVTIFYMNVDKDMKEEMNNNKSQHKVCNFPSLPFYYPLFFPHSLSLFFNSRQ